MRIPDLTIIVPVHERQWTLPRCLGYLEKFEGPVIVADSSQQAYADIAKYPWADYRHIPGQLYYPKMRETFKSVTTRFLVDVPDDDFTLLSGLAACCDHMRENPDVAGCGGHIVRFTESPQGVQIALEHIGANIGPNIIATAEKGATETTPERFERLFDYVVGLNHAVLRKDAATKPYVIMDRAPELQPVRIWGQIVMFGAAALGRISHLDTVLMLRGRDRLWGTKHFPEAMQKQVTVEEIATRVGEDGGVLTDYLVENAELEPAVAREVVQRFVARLARGYPESSFAPGMKITAPLLNQAIARQAADIQDVITIIRKNSPP